MDVLETDINELNTVTKRGSGGHFAKFDVSLNSFEDAKAFYCSVINDYRCGRMPRDRARTLGYLMTGLLGFYKLAIDQELLIRIEALEEKVKDGRR